MDCIIRTNHVSVEQMSDHCVTLARSLGLLWVRVRGIPIDAAHVDTWEHVVAVQGPSVLARVRRPSTGRVVVSRPVVDDQTYVIVLHEMGHVAHPRGQGRPQPGPESTSIERQRWAYYKMTSETAAWEWAYENALCWTPAMEQVRLTCFGTYAELQRRMR